MKVLLWRQWAPLYDHPLVFSSLQHHSVGGTCSQMLWHALALRQLGHDVQVLGASETDIEEEGVDFVGAEDRRQQLAAIDQGRVRLPDLVLLEGGFDAAATFKACWPKAAICHVGQSSEPGRRPGSFAHDASIDFFVCVSVGHWMYYVYRYPDRSHKLALVRNASPFEYFADSLATYRPDERLRVAWVGAWLKPGLREWSRTMADLLPRFSECRWELYGPRYGRGSAPARDFLERELWFDLDLPVDRVTVASVPLPELFARLRDCRLVLTSLGSETACISAMDAHACGRPVLSGADGVFKVVNPDSSGFRVQDAAERLRAIERLLEDPELADLLGANGRTLYEREFSLEAQRLDLEELLRTVEVWRRLGADRFAQGRSIWGNRVRGRLAHWKRKLLVRQAHRRRTRHERAR